MPLRDKYPIEDWVLNRDHLKVGDIIAFYCDDTQMEIFAEVIGFPSSDLRQYISCKRMGSNISEVLNFYRTVVYKVGEIKDQFKCSCGAKYTSNPSYHLPYCDLSQGNNSDRKAG